MTTYLIESGVVGVWLRVSMRAACGEVRARASRARDGRRIAAAAWRGVPRNRAAGLPPLIRKAGCVCQFGRSFTAARDAHLSCRGIGVESAAVALSIAVRLSRAPTRHSLLYVAPSRRAWHHFSFPSERLACVQEGSGIRCDKLHQRRRPGVLAYGNNLITITIDIRVNIARKVISLQVYIST